MGSCYHSLGLQLEPGETWTCGKGTRGKGHSHYEEHSARHSGKREGVSLFSSPTLDLGLNLQLAQPNGKPESKGSQVEQSEESASWGTEGGGWT